ncbi:MAG: YegP family protein [Lewinellaceae bacterium]|nr:YegP family protein [Phaeodactylibacter sp.]MCB9346962.1 YegP family protein [Lewinellaceae bacterium]
MKKSDIPREGSPSSRFGFDIIFKEDKKYYFRFMDAEGQPLLFSKGYSSEKTCVNGVEATIRVAGKDEYYDLKDTKKGKCYFVLKSGNHQEIGRSRLFDTQEQLEAQMKLLKSINVDVPRYGLVEAAPEKNNNITPEKGKEEGRREEKGVESRPGKVKTGHVPEGPIVQPEHVEKRARYKFSVIYYPDSKIWAVKNDFSGGSVKLKTWDGQAVEAFLKSQLPLEEREELLQPTTAPGTAKTKEIPDNFEGLAWKEVELKIRTDQGELIPKFAEKSRISKIELIPKAGGEAGPSAFDAKVLAKSLEDNLTIIIGSASQLGLVDGRLEVPVFGANGLKAGLYILSVSIQQSGFKEQSSRYFGSQLIMLN